jgi:hypothetical protein
MDYLKYKKVKSYMKMGKAIEQEKNIKFRSKWISI